MSAEQRIAQWESQWGPAPEDWRRDLIDNLGDSPAEEMVLLHWERWLESQGEPWSAVWPGEPCRQMSELFGQSQFLSDILIREPRMTAGIADGSLLAATPGRTELRADLGEALSEIPIAEHQAELCVWRRRQLLRIGMRELLDMTSVKQHTRELSDLAEVTIQAALDHVWEEIAQRGGEPLDGVGEGVGFAVLGMGKLGGRELNFSSDIDLIFIYGAEGETSGVGPEATGRVSNHRFMQRLCERLIEFLASHGPRGRLYRVDMRLRPEGSVGPLARSLESLEVYLETQARLWERLAYTKARAVAHRGNEALSERVEGAVRHFCYDERPGPELPRALADLKHRIDREVARSADAHAEVKRGLGGIREIEFVIGLFQLVHGHLHEDLRTTNLLETLRRLRERRLMTPAEARRLRRAYETLRRIEHRLQMMAERQTHTLPSDPASLEIVARRLGWQATESESARRRFLADHLQIASMVHQAFLQHIGAPEVSGLDVEMAAVLDESTSADQAGAILAQFGLGDAEQMIPLLRSLGRGGRGAYVDASAQGAFERLLPALLAWCPQVPSPEMALRRLAGFVDAYKARGMLFTLMAEQPQLVEVLMRLFGASEMMGDLLTRRPEFFDSVVARGLGLAMPDAILEDVWSGLRPRDLADVRRLMDSLRSLSQMLSLAVALRHVLGLEPWTRLAEQMTTLAEFCLRHAWRAHIDESLVITAPVACIALGKFGGREINIGSDLDVLIVCRPPEDLEPSDALEWTSEITRRSEHLMAAFNEPTARGRLFDLDVRLRPEGRNAPLVCTDERLVRYFAEDAQLWEFQTFLRARAVAGDDDLGREVIARVHQAMRQRLAAIDVRAEIRAMRKRLEENADHPGGSGAVDLKRDPGGIIDVEFLVQCLQLEALRDEGTAPEVNTAIAVGEASALDVRDRTTLRRHLLTLRVIECQRRLMSGKSSSSIPADADGWRRLGVAHLGPRTTADEMRTHVREVMAPVREVFERTLIA
jgi:[glutamine synthetase] adenylyltransferase / [glutamine synthetase]-adenylyl-L-tyrosine phosphorylase